MTATNALPLASLAHIVLGHSFRTRLQPRENGSCAVAQLADLEGATLNTASLLRIEPDNPPPRHAYLREGDVLLRTRGQPKAVLVASPPKIYTVVAAPLLILRPRTFATQKSFGSLPPTTPGLYPPYLQWFLNHPQTVASLSAMHTGSRGSILRKSVVESLTIPLPPWRVQEQIVEISRQLEEEQQTIQRMLALRYRYVNGFLLEQAGRIDTDFYEGSPENSRSAALRTYDSCGASDTAQGRGDTPERKIPVPKELRCRNPLEEHAKMCAWLQEIALASEMAKRPEPEKRLSEHAETESGQQSGAAEWLRMLERFTFEKGETQGGGTAPHGPK